MIQDNIKNLAKSLETSLEEDKGIYTLKSIIAERKVFLSKKKLEYMAKFRLDEKTKSVKFTEMLIESGSGLSMGGAIDEMTPGIGFKIQSYKTGFGPREGSIEEQSVLFGKTYQYKFDFKTIREKLKKISQKDGWNFRYQITPIGL